MASAGLPSPEAFIKLISQPLVLQSPLQAVLELLFNALQAQGSSIGDLQGQQHEAQASVAAAVVALETRLAAHEAAAAAEHAEAQARLQDVEMRLHGASNLAGRQAALDEIASIIGVSVPEVAPPQSHKDWQLPSPPPAAQQHNVSAAAPGVANSFERPSHVDSSSSAALSGAGTADGTAEVSFAPEESGAMHASRRQEGSAPMKTALERSGSGSGSVPSSNSCRVASVDGAAVMAGSAASAAADAAVPAATAAAPTSPDLHALQACAEAGRAGEQQATQPSSPASAVGRASAGMAGGSSCGGPTDSSEAKLPSDLPAAGGGSPTPAAGHTDEMPPTWVAAAPAPSTAGCNTAAPHTQEAPLPSVGLPPASAPVLAAASPRVEMLSLAALFASMQAGKSKAASSPAGLAAWPASAVPRPGKAALAAPAHASQQPSRLVPAQHPGRTTPAEQQAPGSPACSPAGAAPQARAGAAVQETPGSGAPMTPTTEAVPVAAGGDPGSRPKSGMARARMLEAVLLMRSRSSLKEGGLLWKLQASLAEAVTEQEHLHGEVEVLQQQLAELRGTSGAGLERCNRRVDAVEVAVQVAHALASSAAAAAASACAACEGESSGVSTARSLPPIVSVEEFKALEGKVDALDGAVAAGAERISRLEARAEADATAVKLVRASSSGSSSADTLAALQSHLLAQQQRLQAQMESMAAGIKQAVPGQVCEAVTGAVGDIGRRLSQQLATKQDLQTLSLKVNSKVSREEVERLLRAHRPPPAPSATDPAAGPASGMRYKCISCDTDLQPFVFAAAPGVVVGGGGQVAQAGPVADLRYSQLPAASPPRNASQPWTANVGGAAVAAPGAVVASTAPSAEQSQLSGGSNGSHVQLPAASLSARPSTGASRLGAPVSWMHRMRRETAGACQDGASASASRRDSLLDPAPSSTQQHPASLTAVALGCPQTDGPAPCSSGGAEGGRQAADWQGPPIVMPGGVCSSEFSEAIREEPMAVGDQALPRPSGGKIALPALPQSSGSIKAARPATALPSNAAAVAAAQRRNSLAP